VKSKHRNIVLALFSKVFLRQYWMHGLNTWTYSNLETVKKNFKLENAIYVVVKSRTALNSSCWTCGQWLTLMMLIHTELHDEIHRVFFIAGIILVHLCMEMTSIAKPKYTTVVCKRITVMFNKLTENKYHWWEYQLSENIHCTPTGAFMSLMFQ